MVLIGLTDNLQKTIGVKSVKSFKHIYCECKCKFNAIVWYSINCSEVSLPVPTSACQQKLVKKLNQLMMRGSSQHSPRASFEN
jgi:hypothetical protein